MTTTTSPLDVQGLFDAFSGNRSRNMPPSPVIPAPRIRRSNGAGSIGITVTDIARNASDRSSTVTNGNITASSALLTRSKIRRMRGTPVLTTQEWQDEAWRLYDITPELAYVTRFEAAAMSRAVIHAARLPDDPAAAPEPVDPDHPATQIMEMFLGGRAMQSQAIARIDTQLSVAGESVIAAWKEGVGSNASWVWAVLSNDEIRNLGGGKWVLTVDGEELTMDDSQVTVIRTWHPHGRRKWYADSPVRHLIPVLSELEQLTKHVSATVDSRLAGAGILLLPKEMEFPPLSDSEKEQLPDGMDDFTYQLFTYMAKPIEDRDAASAIVPLIARVPGELVDKITHIKFSTSLDPETKRLREEAIRRVALGVDFPPEVLLGLSDANHWTSWQIEESSIKLHLEPKLQTVCNAATVGWLHPALKSMGIEDWDRYIAWYDITQIKLRPNRATDAKDLHDDGLITDAARLAATGFDSNDVPTDDELLKMLARKVIMTAPQFAADLLPILFPGKDFDLPSLQAGDPAGISNQRVNPDDDPTPDTREDDQQGIDTSNVDRSA